MANLFLRGQLTLDGVSMKKLGHDFEEQGGNSGGTQPITPYHRKRSQAHGLGFGIRSVGGFGLSGAESKI